MKFSAQEEYGLRCLLQIAKGGGQQPVTIKDISDAEGLTPTNVAKLVNILRKQKFIDSFRGQSGGYVLARPPKEIRLTDVLNTLGGPLFAGDFCERHAGSNSVCAHDTSCSLRGLWRKVQRAVDDAIGELTLADLMMQTLGTNRALTPVSQFTMRNPAES